MSNNNNNRSNYFSPRYRIQPPERNDNARTWWLNRYSFEEATDNAIRMVKYLLPRLTNGEFKCVYLSCETNHGMKWIYLEAFPGETRKYKIILLRPADDERSFGSVARTSAEVQTFLKNFLTDGWWGGMHVSEVVVQDRNYNEYYVTITGDVCHGRHPRPAPAPKTGPNSLHDIALKKLLLKNAPRGSFLASRNPRLGYVPYDRKTMNTIGVAHHPLRHNVLRVARMKLKPRQKVYKKHRSAYYRYKLDEYPMLEVPVDQGLATTQFNEEGSGFFQPAKRTQVSRRTKNKAIVRRPVATRAATLAKRDAQKKVRKLWSIFR